MKKILVGLVAILLAASPALASATAITTNAGGTGVSNVAQGSILFGSSAYNIRLATSSAFQWNDTSKRLSATYASTTALTISGTAYIGSLSGVLKATSGTVSAAANGTDYTLLTATTCNAGDFVSALSASGSVTCTTPASGLTSYDAWTHGITGYSATSTVLYPAGLQTGTSTIGALVATSSLKIANLTGLALTTSGTVSAYAGASCTNQAITALSASGGATCNSITDSYFSGALGIAHGGTNATSFTQSGGITAYDGTRLVNFSGYTLTSSKLTATNASTTNLTASTYLEIPNGSSQAPTVAGQVGLDTTDNQVKVGTGAATTVFSPYRYLTGVYATTTSWTGTSTIKVVAPFAGTLKDGSCKTDTGTLNVQILVNSTAVASMFNASTTVGTVTFTGSNTFSKGDIIEYDYGTPASSPLSNTCTARATESGT